MKVERFFGGASRAATDGEAPDAAALAGLPTAVEAGEPSSGCLFDRDWWLDASSDGRWHRLEARWDDRLVGTLAVAPTGHWGLRYLGMPSYTRTLSPRFDPPPSGPTRRRENMVRILRELLDQLPRHDRFELTLSPDPDLVFPFVRLGYVATVTYTFRVAAGTAPASVLAVMDGKTRNMVKTGRRSFTVDHHHDFDRFERLARRQWQGGGDAHDYPALLRIWTACMLRGQELVLSLRDGAGRDVAAAIIVWDDEVLYFWVSARDPDAAGNSAVSGLLWAALEQAHERGLTFDVDGYGSWSSAQFLGRFGFEAVPRPVINRGTLLWKSLFLARTAIDPNRIDRHFRC